MTEATQEDLNNVGLFTGERQYENFSNMKSAFPTVEIPASRTPFDFAEGSRITLPDTYTYEGLAKSAATFIDETDTGALLVLKDGEVRYEDYRLTGGRHVNWISWSVCKSFVATLVGIAVEEGLIKSIEEPISDYITVDPGSAYDGVRIKDVLQMSSGARWIEDYSDPDCDIHRLGIATFTGSQDDFVKTMPKELEPGTLNRYNSADTQALGMLLVAATGRDLYDYGREKLWEPLGMESPTYWIVDPQGREMAYAGLNMTARDFAKLGELYRNGGNWNGTQVVSKDWITASVTPDAPHLMPGSNSGIDGLDLGYGYQWWIPNGDCGEYTAVGVYNQFVYVDPSRDVVIVKLSANPTYGTAPTQEVNREMETLELFRAIARTFD